MVSFCTNYVAGPAPHMVCLWMTWCSYINQIAPISDPQLKYLSQHFGKHLMNVLQSLQKLENRWDGELRYQVLG